MCKQLIQHVQLYLCPNTENPCDKYFVQKMDRFVSICVERILYCFCAFVPYWSGPFGDEDMAAAYIRTALRMLFPADFLQHAMHYHPLFLQIEYQIALFALTLSDTIQPFLFRHMPQLVKQITCVLEYTIIKLVELFYLSGERISDMWNEIRKDVQLSEIMRRLHLFELVRFRDVERPFLAAYEYSKHVEALIDSYLISLIRARCEAI